MSTLMLKYAAAASRSSNRGPRLAEADDLDGRLGAEKTRGADDFAAGSLVRARALSGRADPAISSSSFVPTLSLIGSPVMG